jgi:hypothetical protein
VPEIDMLVYLPELLDGLMNMLSDPNREIRVAAHKAMMEFLVEIQVECQRTCVWARAGGWSSAAGQLRFSGVGGEEAVSSELLRAAPMQANGSLVQPS